MGAVNYLPYAHSKNNDAPVPIWNGSHAIIDHTTGANVTCQLQRWNGIWYKLPTPDDVAPDEPGRDQVPTTGRYISASLTNLLSIPTGYVWGPCHANTDQPGPRCRLRAVVAVSAAVAALLALLAAYRIVTKQPQPKPEPPAPPPETPPSPPPPAG